MNIETLWGGGGLVIKGGRRRWKLKSQGAGLSRYVSTMIRLWMSFLYRFGQ